MNLLDRPVLFDNVAVRIPFGERHYLLGSWTGRYAHFVFGKNNFAPHFQIPNAQVLTPIPGVCGSENGRTTYGIGIGDYLPSVAMSPEPTQLSM